MHIHTCVCNFWHDSDRYILRVQCVYVVVFVYIVAMVNLSEIEQEKLRKNCTESLRHMAARV